MVPRAPGCVSGWIVGPSNCALKQPAPTFAAMRSAWKRLALFFLIVIVLVALVVLATRTEPRSTLLLAGQIGFLAVASYLLTFVVWPRRTPVSEAHPSHGRPSAVPEEPGLAEDGRPVLVIGDRPAGSRPGSSVHWRDTPTMRASRGRRPGPRPKDDIRWPAGR